MLSEEDECLVSEASSSSSFLTDSGDTGQTGGYGLGMDSDDCFSIGTSQAVTDSSSSMGDVEGPEGGALGSKGRKAPFVLPCMMGTASTIPFVGLELDAAPELEPLRHECCLLLI